MISVTKRELQSLADLLEKYKKEKCRSCCGSIYCPGCPCNTAEIDITGEFMGRFSCILPDVISDIKKMVSKDD